MKRFLFVFGGLFLGLLLGYGIVFYLPSSLPKNTIISPLAEILPVKTQVIGFLPYWLVANENNEYTKYITTLTYFGLTIDTDGTILKLTNPQEEEPGWALLGTNKLNSFFTTAKKNNIKLSLLVFSGDQDAIQQLMDDPIPHANNLVKETVPIMKQYGFTDLNLDIEDTSIASDEAQKHFTQFVTTVKNGLDGSQAGTLTVEISPTDLIKHDLIDPRAIASLADYVVVMAYDYHFSGSYVTGPVAPLSGAGTIFEYDTQTAIAKALALMPNEKIILGAPLYGYEWETIDNAPHAAIIPGTGITASTARIDKLFSTCATCSAQTDTIAKESYLIYKDGETGTYHQIFYPDQAAISEKIDFAKQEKLGGMAVWALGYEGKEVLTPFANYKNNLLE